MSKFGKIVLFNKIILYSGGELLNKLLPFLLLPVLTRYLSPENYGKVAIFETLLSIFMLMIAVGGSNSIKFHYFRLEQHDFSRFLSSVIFISLIVSAAAVFLVSIFGEGMANILDIPIVWIHFALFAAFLEFLTSLRLTLLQMTHRAVSYGVYRISQTIINFGLSLLYVVTLECGWEGRVLSITLASIIFGTLSLGVLFQGGFITHKICKKHITASVNFGLPLIPHGLSLWARTGIDRLLLVVLGGSSMVGGYAAAFQIALVISVLGRSIRMAWEPTIIKGLTDQSPDYREKLVKQIYLYFIFVLAVAGLIAFFSDNITSLILGPEYENTGKLLAWAVFGQAFLVMKIVDIPIMFVGRTSVLAWIGIVSVALHFSMGYIFVEKWGQIGVVWAGSISFFLGFFSTLLYCQKVYPLPWFSVSFLNPKENS